MLDLHPEWRAGVVEIDREHERFFGLARQVIAVIRSSGNDVLVREALDVILQRVLLHFAAEERVADRMDPEAAAILREDHCAIAKATREIVAKVGRVPRRELVRMIEDVSAMLSKHEAEVDVPLFRMMAKHQHAERR